MKKKSTEKSINIIDAEMKHADGSDDVRNSEKFVKNIAVEIPQITDKEPDFTGKGLQYGRLYYGSVSSNSVEFDIRELSRRLGVERQKITDNMDELLSDPIMSKCYNQLMQSVEYKYAFIKLPLSFPEDGICDFGFAHIRSKDLYKNLQKCNSVFLLAVTIGIKTDRLLSGLSLLSSSEHFITDAMASTAVEALCDNINERLKTYADCRPRYSFGFGDCGIENQKLFLDRLNANRVLGITLNESYFMTPSKSVTAVVGILNEKDN